MIETYNLNNFDRNEDELAELKPLKEFKVNECWNRRNYLDPNSLSNGYDFVVLTETSNNLECMGSDRANITLGQPGLLYPKHLAR